MAGVCKEFSYGGCGGNGNNFRSEDDCRQTCLGHRLPGPCAKASPGSPDLFLVDFGCRFDKSSFLTDPNGLSGFVGTVAKACTPRGFYELVQCLGSTGECWCVDPLSGEETPGTRVQPPTQPRCPGSVYGLLWLVIGWCDVM